MVILIQDTHAEQDFFHQPASAAMPHTWINAHCRDGMNLRVKSGVRFAC